MKIKQIVLSIIIASSIAACGSGSSGTSSSGSSNTPPAPPTDNKYIGVLSWTHPIESGEPQMNKFVSNTFKENYHFLDVNIGAQIPYSDLYLIKDSSIIASGGCAWNATYPKECAIYAQQMWNHVVDCKFDEACINNSKIMKIAK